MSSPFRIIFNAARNGPKVFSIQATRPISTLSYKGKPPYKDGSKERQEVIDTTYKGAADLGFDAHDATRAEVAGGFHDHTPGSGPDDKKWITVQLYDTSNNILYHQKADGSEWDRLHLFKDPKINQTEAEKPVKIYTKQPPKLGQVVIEKPEKPAEKPEKPDNTCTKDEE